MFSAVARVVDRAGAESEGSRSPDHIQPIYDRINSAARIHRAALLVGALLSLAAAVLVFSKASSFPPVLVSDDRVQDVYFEADLPRVWRCTTDRRTDCYRSELHPLTRLLVGAPVIAANMLGGLTMVKAVALALAVNAFCIVSLLFYLVWHRSRSVLAAFSFAALLIASAPFQFWAPIPETFPFGATAMLLSVAMLTIPVAFIREKGLAAAGVVSLGTSLTNWVAPLIGAITSLGPGRAVSSGVTALAWALAAWTVQHRLFPETDNPLFQRIRSARGEVLLGTQSFEAARQFVVDAFYPTGLKVRANLSLGPEAVGKLVDLAGVDAIGPTAMVVWALWVALLSVGVRAVWASCRRGTIRARAIELTVIFATLFQIVLHATYGAELNFLYSLHVAPFLVLIASFGAEGRTRLFAVLGALALAVLIGWRNYQLQREAIDLILSFV